MSRSYKKHAYCGDKKDKELKRIANHHVRQYLKNHLDYNPKPADFKRMFESWEICDYGWLYEWEEYWDHCIKDYIWDCLHYPGKATYPDYEKEYRWWYSRYKMK